jgi:serine/threonine protein kinase
MTTVSPDIPLLGGRYELSKRIAGGAMGDVWSASDHLLKRQVAVKIAKSPYREDAIFRERFRLEAQAAAGLSHPGIASVFDYGEEVATDGEHIAYIVMELVDGESLNQLLARSCPLNPARTLQIVSEVGEALQAAHDEGIVHRDIKPANILIRSDGRVKITDFGIARAADAGALTQTGTMLGTVQYMAPEQLGGQTATGAADIYALGVVAYLCLSGQTPFPHAEPMTVAMAHLNDEVPALPATVPKPVRDLVFQMLAKDPHQRPASGHEVASRAASIQAALSRPVPGPTPMGSPGGPGPEAETVVSGSAGVGAATTEPIGFRSSPSATAVMPGPKPRPDLRSSEGPRRFRSTRRAAILAGLLALAVVALVVTLLATGSSSVGIPNVNGESSSAAANRLSASGLHVQLRQVDSARSAGTVVAQSPGPGVIVPTGNLVTLSVSNGMVNVDAAALEGQSYATVAQRLTTLGLVPTEVTVNSTVTPGTVVSMAPSGQVPVGTTVTVTVATGPTPVPTTVVPPGRGSGGSDHGKGHKP